MNKKINVFDYYDYREYLKDSFKLKKQINPRWSYNSLSKSLGVKNNTTILKVLSRERNLGPELTKKLCKYFSFSEHEQEYFLDLIKLDKIDVNSRLGKLIRKNLQYTKEEHLVRNLEFNAETKFEPTIWHFIIRALIGLDALEIDTLKLNRTLCSQADLDLVKIINELESEKLITRDGNKIRNTNEHLEILNSEDKDQLKNIHLEFMKLAMNVFSNFKPDRETLYSSAYTIAIRKNDYAKIREELMLALRSIVNEYATDDVENENKVIYQLQSYLYPIAL